MKKKVFALLVTLALLIGLVSGCAGSGAPEKTDAVEASPEVVQADSSEPSDSEQEVQNPASSETDADEGEIVYQLPLTDEQVVFTTWGTGAPGFMSGLLGPEDNWSSSESTLHIEEITGIKIEYTCVDMFSVTEVFNLMIASSEYPDTIYDFDSMYSGGPEKALSDEVIIDLTEYVTNNMPAYRQAIALMGTELDVINDQGQYLSIYGLLDAPAYKYGPQFRKDWLDALGLEVPHTYDEWHEVGTAFLNEYECDSTFFFTSTLNPGTFFSGGFDLPGFDITDNGSSFYQIDDQIQNAYSSNGMKDYLKLLQTWYADGLLSRDFFNTSGGATIEEAVRNDECGAYFENAKSITQFNTDPDLKAKGFYAVGAPVVVKDEGQITHFSTGTTSLIDVGLAVTTACENVDLLVRFLDWLFTEEGQLLTNYGIEGKSYTLDESGNPQWAEAMSNTEGFSFIQMSMPYIFQHFPTLFDSDRNNSVELDADGLAAIELYSTGFDGAYDLSGNFSLTDDEATGFSNLIGDVNTYASEYLLKCIVDGADIDSTWGDYIAKIEELGLIECIEIYQGAYDRYMLRGE